METRAEGKRGIPMGPTGLMGFPWEREWESELDGNGNGNERTGMEGNGNEKSIPAHRSDFMSEKWKHASFTHPANENRLTD
jgi:hypothetical protein